MGDTSIMYSELCLVCVPQTRIKSLCDDDDETEEGEGGGAEVSPLSSYMLYYHCFPIHYNTLLDSSSN